MSWRTTKYSHTIFITLIFTFTDLIFLNLNSSIIRVNSIWFSPETSPPPPPPDLEALAPKPLPSTAGPRGARLEAPTLQGKRNIKIRMIERIFKTK